MSAHALSPPVWPASQHRSVPSPAAGALAGVVAGALAVTFGMLVAAITDVVSPIDAVGSEVIDLSPRWVKEWAIEQFGTNDKLVLRTGICLLYTSPSPRDRTRSRMPSSA